MTISCEVCVSAFASILSAIRANVWHTITKIIEGLMKLKGLEEYGDIFDALFLLLVHNLPYFIGCITDNLRSQSWWKTGEISEIYWSDLFRQLRKSISFTLYSGHTLQIFHIVISLFASYTIKQYGKGKTVYEAVVSKIKEGTHPFLNFQMGIPVWLRISETW